MVRHLHRGTIFLGVLAFAICGRAVADDMEDGQAAYLRGDYESALRLWRPLAEQGNARAQNNLGVMYENGKGIPEDVAEAIKWYSLAAEQGYAGAQNNLGLIYAIGRGGAPQDQLRAYMWFSLAAQSLSGDVGKTVSQTRDVFAAAMTPRQISVAADMARRCRESSYKDCGLAGTVEAAGLPPPHQTTPAIATTSHAVSSGDYPTDSIRFHESGEVTITYVVNESGFISSCSVVFTSGNPRLDGAACSLAKKRWRYRPATEDGKPVSAHYLSKVVFPPR
jgi:TonB family protein